MKVNIRRNEAFLLLLTAITLFLSFYANAFGVGLWGGWFESFQRDSALVVEKASQCKSLAKYDGPLMPVDNRADFIKVMSEERCDNETVQAYASQYGAQSRVVALFAPSEDDKLPAYFKRVEIVLSAVSAIIFAFAILKIRRMFGYIPACTVTLLLAVSVWVVGYARNLYWILPLMIAPFVFSLFSYQYLKKKKLLWVFYLIMLILLFVKCLNGYEHITTIAISALVPIIYYESVNRFQSLVRIWKQIATMGIVTIIAFAGAYTLHISALAKEHGSYDAAARAISERSNARGFSEISSVKSDVILNFKALMPESYAFVDRFVDLDTLETGAGPLYKYILICIVNYALLPAVMFPIDIKGFFGDIVQSITLWVSLGFLAIQRLRRLPKYQTQASILRIAIIVSLIGAMSWFLLMPGHTLPHAHLNGIVYSLPLLFFVYISIGVYIESWILAKVAKYGKRK